MKACLSISPEQDFVEFDSLQCRISELSAILRNQINSFKEEISTKPISAFILLWAEQVCHDKIYGNRYLVMMNDLVERNLLPIVLNERKARVLSDFSEQNPSQIIDAIRCYKQWSISKREDYVLLYRTFSEWLSKETCGYVPVAKDADRIAAQKRLISFETYIEILIHMDLREQILAKLFYLGGYRTLEEILSLKIEDIDFNRCSIQLAEQVDYSRHLFEDIKIYIEDRKNGYVFLGKDGEKIARTTPFRALKVIVSELKLDPEFTFKDFTKNI